MKELTTATISLCTLLLVACATEPLSEGTVSGQRDVVQADFVIDNVNVVPMNEEIVVPRRAVAVRDGKIIAILDDASSVRIVARERIDGHSGYLLPGLADMHVHMRMDPQAMFDLLLANGVTTVTNMRLGDGDGDIDHLALRAAVADGRMIGPRYLVSGPQLTRDVLPDTDAVDALLNQHVEQGYDVIKIHGDLDTEVYDALIDGADERGLLVTGHLQHELPVSASLRMASIEHAEEFLYTSLEGFGPIAHDFHAFMPTYYAHVARMRDGNYRAALVEQVARSGIYVDPTLIIYRMVSVWADGDKLADLADDERLGFLPEGTRNWYLDPETNPYCKDDFPLTPGHVALNADLLGELVLELHEAGVPLLLGTDTFGTLVPGFSLHDELALLVDAGLSPYDALRTGTVNVAAYLGESDEAGSIEVGKRADFVVLEENPLDDIRNAQGIRGVFTHGRWFTTSDLAAMLDDEATAAR